MTTSYEHEASLNYVVTMFVGCDTGTVNTTGISISGFIVGTCLQKWNFRMIQQISTTKKNNGGLRIPAERTIYLGQSSE